MHYRLGTVSLAATTLLLSLTSPLLPVGRFEVLSAQEQTTQDRKAQADQFVREGGQQYKENNHQAAIESYQKAFCKSLQLPTVTRNSIISSKLVKTSLILMG